MGNKKLSGQLKAADAFYYSFLFVAVFFSTIGFTFSDVLYVGLIALFGILLIVKLASGRYSLPEIAICLILVGIGAFLALRTHKFTVLLTAILLVGAHGLRTDDVLKKYFVFKLFSLVLLLSFGALGIFEMSNTEHYRMLSGAIEVRTSINGTGVNSIHLSLFTSVTLYLFFRFQNIRVSDLAICLAANFLLYFNVTHSMAGVAMTTISVALFWTCSRLRGFGRLVTRIAPFLPMAFFVIMVLFGITYGSSSLTDFVNRLSTGRIAYDHYYLTTYGFSLFGADYRQLISEGFFDDSFIYVPVVYGAAFALLLYGSVTMLLARYRSEGNTKCVLLILIYLLYSVAESMYPSAVVNPSMFLLCDLFFTSLTSSDCEKGSERVCGAIQSESSMRSQRSRWL